MSETQFLLALNKTTNAYRWAFGSDGKTIVGTARHGNGKFNPVTAVNRFMNRSTSNTNAAGTQLGLSTTLIENIVGASAGISNRGNAQVLRGKIRQVLGI